MFYLNKLVRQHAEKRILHKHRDLAFLLSLLFLFLPLIYISDLYDAASLPRYVFINMIAAGSIAVYGLRKFSQSISFRWNLQLTLICVLAVWLALSINWSEDPGSSLTKIMQFIGLVLISIIASQINDAKIIAKTILPSLLLGGLCASLIGIGQYFGYNPFGYRIISIDVPSTFINRNHAAVYLDAIPALALVSLFFYQKRIAKALATLTLAFGSGYLLVSHSRGSILALAGMLAVLLIALMKSASLRKYFLENYKISRNWILLAASILLLILVIPSPNQSTWDTFEPDRATSSSATRMALYLNGAALLTDNIMTGTGYGSFRKSYRSHTDRLREEAAVTEDINANNLHNDILQMFIETGLPGGTLFIVFLFTLIYSGWKTVTSIVTPQEDRLIVLGFFLAFTAILVHSLVDFPLNLPTSAAVFWLSAGIIIGLGNNASLPSRTFNQTFRFAGKFAILAGLLLMSVSWLYYQPYIKSNRDLYYATKSLMQKDCRTGVPLIRHAFIIFPHDFGVQNRFSQALNFCKLDNKNKLMYLNQILAVDATNTRARLTRGNVYLQENLPDLARNDFLYVISVLPHRYAAYAGLGDAALLDKHYEQAKFYYRAALRRNPAYQYAVQHLRVLESL